MKFSMLFAVLAFCCMSLTLSPDEGQWYSIPAQQFKLEEYIGLTSSASASSIQAIELSAFVTYGEYTEYLRYLKTQKDLEGYKNALPDPAIAPDDVYKKYTSRGQFDAEPVVGISWQSAMAYCRWKTLAEKGSGKLKFIYRLPKASEWIATMHYLEGQKKDNDLNVTYADWLLNTRNSFDASSELGPNVSFIAQQCAEPGRYVMGHSFFAGHNKLADYLSDQYPAASGYKHVGFRLVKQAVDNSTDTKELLKFWGLSDE